jgi:hypothetical protein
MFNPSTRCPRTVWSRAGRRIHGNAARSDRHGAFDASGGWIGGVGTGGWIGWVGSTGWTGWTGWDGSTG